MDKFLALEADAYATKIRAAYRGYRIRRQLAAQRSYERRNMAAILVQRAVSLTWALILTDTKLENEFDFRCAFGSNDGYELVIDCQSGPA